jgi:flagellar biosynthesis protein FliQ
MFTQSAYSWDGLTLTHRTVRTGADLSPQWALVRIRRALEDHRGEASGRPSDGRLAFDDSVSSISLTGAVLPSIVSGQVRAESVPDGIAVIATASLTPLIAGLVVSLIASTVFFSWRKIAFTPGYWLWICLLALAGAWHLRQVARVLRMVTTAGTSL